MDQSIKLFVILGTQKFPFYRLINAVEQLVKDNFFTKDEVLIQSGFLMEENKILNVINSLPVDNFNQILINAEIIITHGGVNSILSCMKSEKKFILVPRLKKFSEHIDNHQLEISEVMEKKFNVLVAKDIDDLPFMIQKVKEHVYKPWIDNNVMLLESISDYLKI